MTKYGAVMARHGKKNPEDTHVEIQTGLQPLLDLLSTEPDPPCCCLESKEHPCMHMEVMAVKD